MTEITVENIEGEPVTGEEAPQTFSERLIERGDGDFVEEAPPEPVPVAFQTSQGEVSFAAAPKKRGRPKGKAKPKVRIEPVAEIVPEVPPPQPIDVNALLEPIFQAYMATNEMRKREQRSQRYRDLFQGMVG